MIEPERFGAARKALVLHIGTDKTGTSAIQSLMARNTAPLGDRGVCYPLTGREEGESHHHYLFAGICDFAEKAGFAARADWPVMVDALVKELEGRPEETVLLSSELLSQGVDFAALERLKEIFGSVRIVLYLRRQDEYVLSRYEQAVKTLGMAETFDPARVALPDYVSLIADWENFAGREHVTVRPYHRVLFPDSSVCSDFARHALGLELDAAFELPSEAASNPRLSPLAIEVLRRANCSRTATGALSLLGYITSCASDGQSSLAHGTRNLITSAQRNDILERCAEQNRTLANRYAEDGVSGFFSELESDQGVGKRISPPASMYAGVREMACCVVKSIEDCGEGALTEQIRNIRLMEEVVRDWPVGSDQASSTETFEHICRDAELGLVSRFERLRDAERRAAISVGERMRADADARNLELEDALRVMGAHISGLEDGIVQKDARNLELEDALRVMGAHISGLEDGIVQKDARNLELEDALRVMGAHISGLDDAVSQKDARILELEEALRVMGMHISGLDDVVSQKDALIAELESRSWLSRLLPTTRGVSVPAKSQKDS
jgi:LmbE family N-acetylglucosaminyl deacetylase